MTDEMKTMETAVETKEAEMPVLILPGEDVTPMDEMLAEAAEKPETITLLCSQKNWKRVGNLPYQLHREDGSWIATFLIQIDSQNFFAPEESLITITANNSGS